jgi:transketolase
MTSPKKILELEVEALRIRKKFLSMHFHANAGHVGGGLSAIDILTAIYWSWLRPNDHFILSKGHAASSLYATLWAKGLFSDELIETYYKDGTTLPAHPAALAHSSIMPATGSLGHGLPIAVGMAYSYKSIHRTDARVASLLSDGECNEGSTWEAALFAAHHRLSNLLVIIDANGLQGFGSTTSVMNLEPFVEKWKAFGFKTIEADGHDFSSLLPAFSMGTVPVCVIARTTKGKSVIPFENRMDSHYKPLTQIQYQDAIDQLDDKLKLLEAKR